jgi:hypothetical protein
VKTNLEFVSDRVQIPFVSVIKFKKSALYFNDLVVDKIEKRDFDILH